MRWGTNTVEQTDISLAVSGTVTFAFSTRFSDSGQSAHEAQAANGDSGGAIFVRNRASWELAGIMTAIGTWGECNQGAALYGNLTYAADLSRYLDQIREVTDVPACHDGLDQDGDGLVDYPDDPGCDDLLDAFETSDALPCDDGLDNDGDGMTDFDPVTFAHTGDHLTPPSGSGDPSCFDPLAGMEDPQCQDGIDNDGDGEMDFDAGTSANGTPDSAGPDSDCLDKPWSTNEARSGCGVGGELAILLPLIIWMRRWRACVWKPSPCDRGDAQRTAERALLGLGKSTSGERDG
jgi:hypothetical protein